MFVVTTSSLLLLFSWSLGNNGVVAWSTPSPFSTGASTTYGSSKNKLLMSREIYASSLHRDNNLFMSVDSEQDQTVVQHNRMGSASTRSSLQIATRVMATIAAIAAIVVAPSMATAASVPPLVEADTSAMMMAASATTATSILTAKSGAAGTAALPSALFASMHYSSILAGFGVGVAERFQIKPNMTMEEEERLGWTDTFGWLIGIPVVVSGYYRVTQYGKGWDFYSHEPIFWVKMGLVGALVGMSLFPTIITMRRTIQIKQVGEIEPMSEKLASRMISILNAELSTVVSIPLAASLMSRGVGTLAMLDHPSSSFPTSMVGPTFTGLLTVAASYKYVKEALEWTDEDELLPASSSGSVVADGKNCTSLDELGITI